MTSRAWRAGADQATETTIYTPDQVAPASVTSAIRLVGGPQVVRPCTVGDAFGSDSVTTLTRHGLAKRWRHSGGYRSLVSSLRRLSESGRSGGSARNHASNRRDGTQTLALAEIEERAPQH